MSQKVFCIGFHKTGTTSMQEALKILGYRVTGPNWIDNDNIADEVHEQALKLVPKYDAFQDNPWPIIYPFLDDSFPGSKFILTTRDTDSWLSSQVKHFGTKQTPMRKWIYGEGCPEGNEERYVERYEQHNADVLEYFAGRENDLLVLDVVKGDGWEQLCPFLGREIPEEPFPHANKASGRSGNGGFVSRMISKLRS